MHGKAPIYGLVSLGGMNGNVGSSGFGKVGISGNVIFGRVGSSGNGGNSNFGKVGNSGSGSDDSSGFCTSSVFDGIVTFEKCGNSGFGISGMVGNSGLGKSGNSGKGGNSGFGKVGISGSGGSCGNSGIGNDSASSKSRRLAWQAMLLEKNMSANKKKKKLKVLEAIVTRDEAVDDPMKIFIVLMEEIKISLFFRVLVWLVKTLARS